MMLSSILHYPTRFAPASLKPAFSCALKQIEYRKTCLFYSQKRQRTPASMARAQITQGSTAPPPPPPPGDAVWDVLDPEEAVTFSEFDELVLSVWLAVVALTTSVVVLPEASTLRITPLPVSAT